MFILFGFKTKPSVEGAIKNKCPSCKRPSIIRIIKITTWFTLFFIPIIPLGNQVALECINCGSAYRLKGEAKKNMLNIIQENKQKRLEK